ncbi:hypothetical protein WG66_001089 [Moniliophthora roreri]|nr:hypothetical protein WG66_001089 [Moniliophthora roreri]
MSVGVLLAVLAAVARPIVTTVPSVCFGCKIACVVWLLRWYGWGSGVGFGGHGDAGSGLGGANGFMSRTPDIYLSFALAARIPAFCMVCSAVSWD